MNYSSDLNLGEGLCIFASFHFPDSGLYHRTVLIFILIYFDWRDTENQPAPLRGPAPYPIAQIGAIFDRKDTPFVYTQVV